MAKLVLIKDNDKRIVIREDINENVSPLDIFVRSDFIAMKAWCKEDIAVCLREEGYEDTDEDIDVIVNSRNDFIFVHTNENR